MTFCLPELKNLLNITPANLFSDPTSKRQRATGMIGLLENMPRKQGDESLILTEFNERSSSQHVSSYSP